VVQIQQKLRKNFVILSSLKFFGWGSAKIASQLQTFFFKKGFPENSLELTLKNFISNIP